MKRKAGSRKAKAKGPSARKLAEAVANAAADMKGEDIVLMEVAELVGYADYFILASGRSTRHAQSIAENVQREVMNAGSAILGVEGDREGNWILIDAGDVVAHVFYHPVRLFYEIEKIWSDARIEPWPAEDEGRPK